MIDEPLAESAPLARRLAAAHCRGCEWNHGVWQYLRLLGLNHSPRRHAEFFASAFSRMALDRPRVLVSGAADYSMYAHVQAALRAAEITVVDVCETPLALTRWYAERIGTHVGTEACDILQYRSERPFDVVCTHSFLGQFPADQRPALLVQWHRLLRPGGLAITVNRLRPAAGDAQVAFTAGQVRDYAARALQKARAAGLPDAEAIARQAEQYAARQRPWPLRTREDAQSLFENAGFRIEELTCAPVDGTARQPGLAGPSVPGSDDFARIVAARL